ncbi:MAG: protein kinase [Planctomycetaceae bacterium]|nr:protein kinase [Planctomycetaceae bacterium]
MEPPSPRLLQILRDLRLCTPSDLRRCRGHVRRLARDIPAFDSVWIDALLHLRKLTPFQARMLESDRPEDLRVGPCVLADRLGGGRFSTTWLARRIEGSQKCILKQVTLAPELLDRRSRALEDVVHKLRGIAHPGFVGPLQTLKHEGRLVAISIPVDGPHLGELMVRRGRFPAAIVHDLAEQLLESLAVLESHGLVHGDVSLRNVRVTSSGQAVLTDAGLTPALFPELTIHAGLAPDRYDGVAPELIGTGRTANSASDVYALGCLLWHLLAGRPPYPTNDPLGKLAAHQTRVIADVREWAPETPTFLAEAILAFTRPNPKRRPQSFREILGRWGARRSGTRRRLAAFRRQFEMPAAFVPTGGSGGSRFWPIVAACVFVLSGLLLAAFDQNTKETLLSLPGQATRWARATFRPAPAIASAGRDATEHSEGKPIPTPDARGVIELPDAGPWEAADISSSSVVVLRGNPLKPAVVLIHDTPLRLSAERVRVENIIVRFVGRAASPGDSSARPFDDKVPPLNHLIAVEANRFELRTCRLEGDAETNEPLRATSSKDPAWPKSDAATGRRAIGGIEWRPLESDSSRDVGLALQDSVIQTSGVPVRCEAAPTRLQIRNVLALSPEPFVTLGAQLPAARHLHVDAARLTLRGAAALLHVPVSAGDALGRLHIDATDCVLSLKTEGSFLIQFEGDRMPPDWARSVAVDGEGSLLSPGCDVAGLRNVSTDSVAPLDSTDVDVGGLTAATFEFAGRDPATDLHHVVRSWNAPRRSSTPPGIDPTRFAGHTPRPTLARGER